MRTALGLLLMMGSAALAAYSVPFTTVVAAAFFVTGVTVAVIGGWLARTARRAHPA